MSQHLGVFHTYLIEIIISRADPDHIFKFFHAAFMIDKAELKMNAAVKIIQKITPVFKNSIFILILSKLIVNIRKPDCLRITSVFHPADPVSCHLLVGNGLLSGNLFFILFRYRFLRFPSFRFFYSSFLLFFMLFYHIFSGSFSSGLFQAPSFDLFSCQ